MTRVLIAAAAVLALSAQNPTPPVAPDTSCPETATAIQALLRSDVRLRDWPALARYREANRALAAPAAGQSRVVFMGDSITDIWAQPRFSESFPKAAIGRGISGQTTPQMLIRFRPDVIDLKPKVVVILAGTNDIAANTGAMTNEEIEGNLQSMAELAKVHGIKVVLSSITPTGAYHVNPPTAAPQSTLRPMSRIIAINTWMKTYAAANGHVYLDYFTPMLDATGVMKAELTGDDLHPNAAGYAIMAPLAQAAIEKALR